jgi:hypothetical protein
MRIFRIIAFQTMLTRIPHRVQASTGILDITTQIPLTKDECRKKLTAYLVFSIRKIPPLKVEEKPTWARAQITEERLSQQEIFTKIKNLSEARLSVSEKKAALTPFQQGQVTTLLDDMNSRERDRSFEWALEQLEKQEREIRVGLRETVVLLVFVRRAPRDEVDPIALFKELERRKAEPAMMMRPPQQHQRPPSSGGGGGFRRFSKGRNESATSSASSHHRSRFTWRQRRRPIKLGRKLREELRIRRMRKKESPKHGWYTSSDSGSGSDSDTSISSRGTGRTPKTANKVSAKTPVSRGPPTYQPPLSTKLCIFITSRNDEVFSQKLAKTLDISIDLTTEEQIIRVIEQDLSKLPGLSEQTMGELKRRLQVRAEGRLTWIKLAMRELSRIAGHIVSSDLRATILDTIPNDLEGFYQLDVTRGDGLRSALGKAVLTCMSLAIRPLNIAEFRFLAGSLGLSETRLEGNAGLEPYVEVTGFFLEISNRGRIGFIDETARQFVKKLLENEQAGWESSHAILAQQCLRYLANPEVSTYGSSRLEYPITCWMDHCQLASDKIVLGGSISQEFFQKSSKLTEEWVATYWKTRYQEEERPSGSTFLHIFAEAGSYQLFEQIFNYLRDRADSLEHFNSVDSLGNLPLHWAARKGHVQIVQSLWLVTDHLDRVNYDELTPLHFAAMGGYCEIAEGFIRRGANINSRARNATTVLQSASSKGHEKMVQLLLDGGAFIDATDMDGYRAQHLARTSGHDKVADMLKRFESRMISTESLPASVRVDGGFIGTIIDFVHPESGLYVDKHIPMDRMLSNESFDSIMSGVKGQLRSKMEDANLDGESPEQKKLRWLHLPANNVS